MVRKAEKKDLEILANLAILMWNNHSVNELIAEFSETISNGNSQFFLKYIGDIPIGFAQCQLRYDYVEGTKTTPVGYLEACEIWAKDNGCLEFASDCEIDNIDSYHFHKAMNFTEANRIICFTKEL